MLGIQLICVGKLKERYFAEACGEYIKRLGAYARVEILEVAEQRLPDKPSAAEIRQALEREAAEILKRTAKNSKIYTMCIEGKQYSSEEFSGLLTDAASRGMSRLVFVIGGSFGLADCVKEKAAGRISMSRMTFPHHLARVMLLEQLYRGFQIGSGGNYHK